MEQVLAGFSGMADSYMLEWLAAVCLILVAVAMALFDLPGNTAAVWVLRFTIRPSILTSVSFPL